MSSTTNDDVISDLKQFVAATISQQTTEVRQDIQKLSDKIDGVDKKVDDLIGKLTSFTTNLSFPT